MKASLLYRLHNSEGAPTAEAGVNATAVPATRFVTFAEQGKGQFGTGVAYANPSPNISVPVTFTARDTAGELLASVVRTLLPGGHDAHGMSELFGLPSFTGSIEVTSDGSRSSGLSLNFEARSCIFLLASGGTGCCRAVICQVKPSSSAGNHRIRRVDSTRAISTIAGTGGEGFGGDGGSEVHGQCLLVVG